MPWDGRRLGSCEADPWWHTSSNKAQPLILSSSTNWDQAFKHMSLWGPLTPTTAGTFSCLHLLGTGVTDVCHHTQSLRLQPGWPGSQY